jgi:DNA-binding transcriptional ArsR family regulator
MTQPDFERLAIQFEALGNETRLRILRALPSSNCGLPMPVGLIANMIQIKPASCSKHLGILYRAGLVKQKRHGTFKVFTVNGETFLDLLPQLEPFYFKETTHESR